MIVSFRISELDYRIVKKMCDLKENTFSEFLRELINKEIEQEYLKLDIKGAESPSE